MNIKESAFISLVYNRLVSIRRIKHCNKTLICICYFLLITKVIGQMDTPHKKDGKMHFLGNIHFLKPVTERHGCKNGRKDMTLTEIG